MVVFSVIIMVIVLFFRKGIMGERELDLDRVGKFFTRTVPSWFGKKKASGDKGGKEVSK